MVPRAEPEHALPHPAARGLCARRPVSEANRGNAPALRPEIAALPRYRQQMCNIFTPFRASRTPLLTNNLFAYHKFCMRNTARPQRGQVTPPYRKWQGTSHFLSFAAKSKPAERCEHRPLQIICSVCHNPHSFFRKNEGIPPHTQFFCLPHSFQSPPDNS